MGKQIPVIINSFNGGMVNDLRSGWTGSLPTTNKYAVSKHFDAFTYPHKLLPQYATEAAGADTAANQRTYNILQTLYAPYGSLTTPYLYGLGKTGSYAKLYTQNIEAGSLDALTWQAASSGEAGSGTQRPGLFQYYKGYIYLMTSSTNLGRYKVDTAQAFTDAYQTLSATTNPIQAVVHPADDCIYFFSDTNVYRLNNTTWDSGNPILTGLPSDMQIVAACAFGNYLAIGMTTTGTSNKHSYVFLWDRDSSLTTLTQRIDFGRGTLCYLANLNGRLIGVMDSFGNNAYSLNRGKLLIKRQNGDFADILNILNYDTTFVAPTYQTNFYVEDDKLYFVASAPLNSDTRAGIWATDYNGRLSLWLQEANASQVSYYNCIYKTAEIFWIGYYDGTGNVVSRSVNDETYSASLASVYESLIYNAGDTSQKKKLTGVTVMTEPLPSGGQVVLKYRKNVQNPDDGTYTAETSWTTIFTHNTQNSISHDAVNIESTGNTLPAFNEIQFRIESTGGATITGLRFAYEVIEDAPYQP